MTGARRLGLAGALVIAVVAFGTVGFVIIENVRVFDSLYMTVTTVTTVGYREVFELSHAGRIFNLVLIVMGIGSVFYTATTALELAVDNFGRRRSRPMERSISRLKNHFIVCGFGRVGRNAWEHIASERRECVVIEKDPAKAVAARSAGALVVEGDATLDETLDLAQIELAAGLIASVTDDTENVFIVLSARARRPDLLIVARANELEAEHKLVLAGADRVVAPQAVGGFRLASLALRRELADVIDLIHGGQTVEVRVEELEISPGAPLEGHSLRSAEIRRVFQYHGAEHMTIFNWEAEVPLSVENARIRPRLHPRCGTSFLFFVMIVSILVFALLGRPETIGKIYECAGPTPYTLSELVRLAGRWSGHERPQIPLPEFAGRLQAMVMEWLPGEPLMSRDNIDSMRVANVATTHVLGLSALGITPSSVQSIAPLYLSHAQGPARLDPWRARAGRR